MSTLLLRSLLLVAVVLPISASAQARFRLGEILFDSPESAGGLASVEIRGSASTSLAGYWLLAVDAEGAEKGAVELRLDLDAMGTGSNGLFLILDSKASTSPAAETGVGLADFAIEDGAKNFILGRGMPPALGTDLDSDNDGILDAGALAAFTVADAKQSAGAAASSAPYAASLGFATAVPANTASKSPGAAGPGSPGACCMPYGACIVTASQTECESHGGTWDGSANCTGISCPATATVVLNEIRIAQPGADNSEYFELKGTPALDMFGLTHVVIGDLGTDSGRIDDINDLGSLGSSIIAADGFFVGTENTFESAILGNVSDQNYALLFEDGDNVTHLLVAGFTGLSDQDLDTNNDGVLDITPWTVIIDKVAVIKEQNPPTTTEWHYGPPTVGPNGTGIAPFQVYRFPDGPSGVWTIGQDTLGCTDTPGFPNSGDTDGDCDPDSKDNCPTVANAGQENADGDSAGDACDGCPNDPAKIAPGICGCGAPDTDTDGDGTPDCVDACPNDPNKIAAGLCGCGVPDTDSDGDGTPDCLDACPNDPNKIAPGICGCGVADTDTDGDGTADCNDGCPNDPSKIAPGLCGCGTPDTDTDGDGTADCLDACPNDPNKIAPGLCGCGVPDTDTDGDGTPNCLDGCPNDPAKTAPGICGCGTPDTDTDGDGVPDCGGLDGCPNDPNKIAPGICGCGIPDTDTDGDGTPDCLDACPSDPTKILAGLCGCGIPEGCSLGVDIGSISAAAGGLQSLFLYGGAANAGKLYLLLGSLSGTSPGLPVDIVLLPLNVDSYFLLTLTNHNSVPISNGLGFLNPSGNATAGFFLPSGTSLGGLTFTAHHAYVVIETSPGLAVSFASNAAPVLVLP